MRFSAAISLALAALCVTSTGQQPLEPTLPSAELPKEVVLNPRIGPADTLSLRPGKLDPIRIAQANATTLAPPAPPAPVLPAAPVVPSVAALPAAGPGETMLSPVKSLLEEEAVPCFGDKPCDRDALRVARYGLPDPNNPNDWMTPTVVDYPPEKQTNTIPHYKNDVSCCGGPGQEFTSTLGDRTDSMSIKENTGGDTYYGHKDPNDPRPCRPCSPSPVTGYEEPEKAPDEYMTPTMRNHVVSDILLEEKVKADPFGPTRVGHLLEGDEVNHMYMTPDKSVELPNGDIQMMNPAATPIGAYDPKVYEGMHEKIELIDDLDTLKHPCDHEGCEPPVVPEWAGCKSCVKKIGGFYTPEYSPRSPAHNDIEVVALEEQVVLLDKNLCSCECVSEKEFATANPAVAGACPVCPVCTPLGPKLVTSVSCAKAHEGLKRPECAPEPTATMAIHKYRKMQKTYTVIPEIAKGALN